METSIRTPDKDLTAYIETLEKTSVWEVIAVANYGDGTSTMNASIHKEDYSNLMMVGLLGDGVAIMQITFKP